MYTTLNTIARKALPDWICKKLIASFDVGGIKRYATNTGWLFFGRIFSFAVSFFIVAIVARYLGPENLGKLGYAQSFVAIFSVFASLGIDQILARDLVVHPEKERQILGTAFGIKLLFGILTTIATVATAYFTSTDSIFIFLILILSLSFIVQPFNTVGLVFSARVKSKYTAFAQIATSIVVPLLKLLIIFFAKGILFFAGVMIIEVLVSTIVSLYYYIKVFHHSPLKWRIDIEYGITLIKNSTPLLFAGLSGYLFAKMDQVMLQHMLGSEAVGLYSVAVNLTDILGIMSGLFVASLFPALVNANKTNRQLYLIRLKQLFFLLLSVNLVFSFALTSLASLIIPFIFGAAFLGSITVLMIFAWKLVAVVPLVLIQQHLIIENKNYIFLSASIATAVLNIILNYTLIPIYGPNGAAIATIISYFSYILIPLSLHLKK